MTSKTGKTMSSSEQNTVGKSQLQLETQRMLDTSKKKLTLIEQQRIMAVMEDTCVRLELVGLFAFMMENLERFTVAFGQHLVEQLSLHSDMYEQLMQNLNPTSERANPEELQRKADLLQLNLHHSTKTILRLFASNPAAIKVVRTEFERATPEETKAFIGLIKEGKALLLQRLLATPFEEKQRMDYFTEMTDRCGKNDTVIKKLRQDLAEATKDKEEEVAKRNEIIRKLKLDIHSIERSADEHISRTKVFYYS